MVRSAHFGTFRIVTASAKDANLLRAIDDDACELYALHGVHLDLPHNHAFAEAELARWQQAVERGQVFMALDSSGTAVGFAAVELLDGEPYLDQLSVRFAAMRRGIGGKLLQRAVAWACAAQGSALWLTTYDHLPFNRPYYEQRGFSVVPESACAEGLRRHLDEQRRNLPDPSQRIAMRRPL